MTDKQFKLFPPADQLESVMGKFLGQDEDAKKYLLAKLKELLVYFQESNVHTIRGMSLFMVVDSKAKKYALYMIDLASLEKIEGDQQHDEGLIFGVQNLIKLLEG